jgi:FtsP/CotA-like multicopper oxidase with cupredoxin domain
VKTDQRKPFRTSPIAAAIAVLLLGQFPAHLAWANAGFGEGVNAANNPIKLPTFNANSPVGPVVKLDPVSGLPKADPVTQLPIKGSSGAALRKFVDSLPGFGPTKANNLKTYIPLATAEKWIDPNGKLTTDDYLEIAAIEYSQKLHTDLARETHLRGYVQLSTPRNPGKHIALRYLDGTPILDASGVQVYAYDNPHHLGPVINATRGTPLRVKFVNLLPMASQLFLPVDSTVTGAGVGPDAVTPYSHNRASLHLVGGEVPWISAGTPHQWIAPAGETNPGVTSMAVTGVTQTESVNPATLQTDTQLSWTAVPGATGYTVIANGVHKVVTGTSVSLPNLAGAAVSVTADGLHAAVVDARGVSAFNVPDMPDPGPGASTLYFPNDVSARFTLYHDRASGLTRLNTYAGLEAGYLVTDPTEKKLISDKLIPGAADTIPLIIEDKTFVPADIAQQDAKWNKDASGAAAPVWGKEGDLWFPHVYEPNQDPTTPLGFNPVGRFDFGPHFWPIFPAKDPLPSGAVGDATIVPAAYMDTPVVNGTAYPYVTVEPKAYRFRILNGSVDRYLNLGLYKTAPDFKDAAKKIPTAPQLDPNGNPILDATGAPKFFSGTEVSLVRALAADALGNPPTPSSAEVPYDPSCQCQYPTLPQNVNTQASGPARAWPIDDRRGGTPDPTSVGPDIIAIGNDGGFLPSPVDIPSQPITFEANRRSITVNNAYGYGLLLGPAERSDVIIDFSAYAGQTLIVYNDAPAPFPFADDRNDYYTDNPDLTPFGGAYPTKPGYGPNTRTILQIRVSNTTPAAPYNTAALLSALPAAYKASQAEPLVPAVAYNKAFGTNDPDVYARISAGAAGHPTLDFSSVVGGVTLTGLQLITAGGVKGPGATMILNTGSGSGYDPKSAPLVEFSNTVNGVSCLAPGGVSASAQATVDPVTRQVDKIINFNPGSGYTCLPTVSFVNTSPVTSIALLNGGSGYTNAQVSFVSKDQSGSGASATAVVVDGVVTGFKDIVGGSGYTTAPDIVITEGAAGATGAGAIGAGATGGGATANAVLAPTLGVGAQATVLSTGRASTLPIVSVAEQELFDNRGRYNFTGGVEMPFSTAINQTTVPLNYIDAATESLNEGDVQVWKVVVNGLFSNNLSFNLADVQLINRVGWDGTIKPPSSNELGWKSSVRLNPLEDLVVAVKARLPKLPFGLPQSVRPRDPSKKLGEAGSGMGFTAGQGVPQLNSRVNTLDNYDNEFFWNSALLSNSETDFVRPIVFRPNVIKPDAPTNLGDPQGNGTLTWTDPTPATLSNPKNEIGFKILQAKLNASGNIGEFSQAYSAAGVAQTVPANVTQWKQPLPIDTSVVYAVVAYNAAGESLASESFSQTLPVAPTTFNYDPATLAYNAVSLSWSGGSSSNKLELWRTTLVSGVAATPVLIATLPGTTSAYVDRSVGPVASYSYQIKAINALNIAQGASGAAVSAALAVATPMVPVAAPSLLSAVPNTAGTTTTLRWSDNANNETAYWVDVSSNGATVRTVLARTAAQKAAAGGTASTTISTVPGNTYSVSVTAVNVSGGATSTSAPATTTLDLTLAPPAAPVLSRGTQTATRAPINWTAVPVSGGTVSYVVQVSTNGGAFVSQGATANLTANVGIAAGNTYQVQVLARVARFGQVMDGAPSTPIDILTPPAASSTPQAALATGARQVTLTWTNGSTSAISSFTIDRRLGNGTWLTLPAVTATSAAGTYRWTDTVPAAGTYRYRVLASGAGGSSAYTAQSNAITVR